MTAKRDLFFPLLKLLHKWQSLDAMRTKIRSNEEHKHLQFGCHGVLIVSTSSLEKQKPGRGTDFVSNN